MGNTAKTSRATFLIQFAATAAGFMVSAYLVSTVIFDFGPAQNIAPWVRFAVSGVALTITLGVVLGLTYASTRGLHAWKLEGGKLLLFHKEGEEPKATIELSKIESVKVRDDDWGILQRAEAEDLESGIPASTSEEAQQSPHQHGELEITAKGTIYVVHMEALTEAREAAKAIEAARAGAKAT